MAQKILQSYGIQNPLNVKLSIPKDWHKMSAQDKIKWLDENVICDN